MANRYWVGGTAAWDGTAGTKWSATSGGAGGASVPTSADDVFFDANSGASTVTISTATANFLTLTCTGFTGTIAGTTGQAAYGNVTLGAGMTWSNTGNLAFQNVTATFTTNGVSFAGSLNVNSGGTVSLGSALTTTAAIFVNQGTFNTNNYNVTATQISTNNSNTRTINLGSSTVTLSALNGLQFPTVTNLTFNAGTSSIVMTSSVGSTIVLNGITLYNLTLSAASASNTFQSSGTFNNLTLTAPASAGVSITQFDSRMTINGTLSTTGTAGNRRVWLRNSTYGIAITLTVNSTPSLTDADFRDIYVIGTAAPISGTRVGNLRGCSGITFSTPKTVYWVTAAGGNWSGNNWAATSGGAASTDNFPLAQDTAIIENTGLNASAVISWDSAIPYTGTLDASSRTLAFSLNTTGTPAVYGDWKYGSAMTVGGAGTLTFSGRNTQTIASAGRAFGNPLVVDSYGGTVQLADAINAGASSITVTNGTFDTKNFSVTAGSLSSSNSNVRTITLGSSTVTLSNTIGFSTSTNLTFNAGTSQINIAGASVTVNGGGLTYNNVTFTGAINAPITGTNTFNNLTVTAPAAAGIIFLQFSANQTITGTLTVAGATAVRRIFLQSNTLGTTRTLTVGTLSAQDCDFRDITIAGAAAGSSPTRAGDCGGNTGITFPAPKTVYWNLAGAQNWSSTGWASSSGGSPAVNNFPLAQDTAVFDNTGSVTGTITIDAGFNVSNINASARTSAMTLLLGTATPIYGSFTLGTGVTTSGGSALQFFNANTATITSNGVQISYAINIQRAKVQLADAFSSSNANSFPFILNGGEFDAVTYNVTLRNFSFGSGTTARTLRMGTGTWTLTSSSTVWDATTTANAVLYKGTANIVLSDTSTSARQFDGGGLSYNKLTIGGTTGTSTLTITGTNQFTELASTKTVAHTIALGTTTQTLGKWTVTGTVGNVVTVTGTATLFIAGGATSGLDYLAMGTTALSTTSPGEFYAGANSTGTGTGITLTAPPAPRTLYWVGGTGNWSSTTKWSTSSGGASGAAVPTSLDDVIFNSASNATAYTATIDPTQARCKSLTIAGPASGNLTLAGTGGLACHGNVTFPASGIVLNYTGNITLTSNSTGLTFTTNGQTLSSVITVNGVDCSWTLGSAINIGVSNFFVTNGSFSTANYNVSCQQFNSNNANTRSITLGSSTVDITDTLSFTNPINLTFSPGTSQINLNSASSTLNSGSLTFYNVSFTAGNIGGSLTINGSATFNNLTKVAVGSTGITVLQLGGNQTVTGTFTCSAGSNATARNFVRSDTLGTTRTITAAAVSLTDVDFRDITIAGAAAPASGTRLGNCAGNSGITFPVAKTVYWNLAAGGNWSATAWATSSGGSPAANNFPLAQDTAIIENTGLNTSATVTVNAAWNIGTINMSTRSNAMTFTTSTSNPNIYGNWVNGAGTTLAGNGTITWSGRSSQTITSAGKTFTLNMTINSPNGTVTLSDALTNNYAGGTIFTITAGTFDAAGYNVTFSGGGFASSNSNTRTIAVGSGTWSFAGATPWNCATSTNLTVTGTGTITLTSASAKTFDGGGISYSGITLDQGGAGTLTISGNNTFKNITNTYSATGAANITIGTTTQTVTQWTGTGAVGKVLTVQGTSASSPGTLILSSGTVNVDYLTITGVRAYPLTTTWYAGANSTNNGSLGWIFSASTPTVTFTGNFFHLFPGF